jgi:hypothetical protein
VVNPLYTRRRSFCPLKSKARQGKAFFFEKKKQKAFVSAVAEYPERSASG